MFADWLEEHGDPMCEVIRHAVEYTKACDVWDATKIYHMAKEAGFKEGYKIGLTDAEAFPPDDQRSWLDKILGRSNENQHKDGN